MVGKVAFLLFPLALSFFFCWSIKLHPDLSLWLPRLSEKHQLAQWRQTPFVENSDACCTNAKCRFGHCLHGIIVTMEIPAFDYRRRTKQARRNDIELGSNHVRVRCLHLYCSSWILVTFLSEPLNFEANAMEYKFVVLAQFARIL